MVTLLNKAPSKKFIFPEKKIDKIQTEIFKRFPERKSMLSRNLL